MGVIGWYIDMSLMGTIPDQFLEPFLPCGTVTVPDETQSFQLDLAFIGQRGMLTPLLQSVLVSLAFGPHRQQWVFGELVGYIAMVVDRLELDQFLKAIGPLLRLVRTEATRSLVLPRSGGGGGAVRRGPRLLFLAAFDGRRGGSTFVLDIGGRRRRRRSR